MRLHQGETMITTQDIMAALLRLREMGLTDEQRRTVEALWLLLDYSTRAVQAQLRLWRLHQENPDDKTIPRTVQVAFARKVSDAEVERMVWEGESAMELLALLLPPDHPGRREVTEPGSTGKDVN